MATYVPPKRATAFRFWVSLIDQTNTKKLKSNPTLAAGDVKVSKDGGATANLTTLPAVTPASSVFVQVDLSATEMTADNVSVSFIDAAGAEWCDLFINLQTAARQVDDLAYPATSGRSLTVSAAGEADANVAKWLTAAPNALVASRVDVSVGAMAANVVTAAAIANAAIDAATLATDLDSYEARLTVADDNTNTTDRYEVVWWKNGVPLTSGITSPTIQVIKASDGSDLVASTAMTQIGSTGQYRYNEGTNRISDGAQYVVVVQATIDSATRSARIGLSRDSA